MATYCYFCEKKMGMFSDSYWNIDGKDFFCNNCYNTITQLFAKVDSEESLNAAIDEVCKLYPNKITEEIRKQLPSIFAHAYEEQRRAYLEKEKERQAQEAERIRLEKERKAEQLRKEQEKLQLAEELRRQEARRAARLDALKAKGYDGYYEYKIIHLQDGSDGSGNYSRIENTINDLGLDGWHLRCAYTNEIGKTSNSSTSFGYTSSTNATIDENVLIFERFVRFEAE